MSWTCWKQLHLFLFLLLLLYLLFLLLCHMLTVRGVQKLVAVWSSVVEIS
jgi:hypothetical protein